MDYVPLPEEIRSGRPVRPANWVPAYKAQYSRGRKITKAELFAEIERLKAEIAELKRQLSQG